MKKIISFVLIIIISFSGCTAVNMNDGESNPSDTFKKLNNDDLDTIKTASLNDADFLKYVEDSMYIDLINDPALTDYLVSDIDTKYVSKEYLEEVSYNSKENIYFGYTLSELYEEFGSEGFSFTLGEFGETEVERFEPYDDTYDKMITRVAVGAGVILVCVTLSAIAADVGASSISVILSASAETAADFAVSQGVLSAVTVAAEEFVNTGDIEKAKKLAAEKGSESFMWGAVAGALSGDKGALDNTQDDAFTQQDNVDDTYLQKDLNYPIELIRRITDMEQVKYLLNAGIIPEMIGGRIAMVRTIDYDRIDEVSNKTNIELMREGSAPLDPNGKQYLAIPIGNIDHYVFIVFTEEEYQSDLMLKIVNFYDNISDKKSYDALKTEFWKNMASKVDTDG